MLLVGSLVVVGRIAIVKKRKHGGWRDLLIRPGRAWQEGTIYAVAVDLSNSIPFEDQNSGKVGTYLCTCSQPKTELNASRQASHAPTRAAPIGTELSPCLPTVTG